MNKKNKRILSVCALASLLVSGSAVTGVKADSSSVKTYRISGTDRYKTAVAIAEDGWKDGSDYAVIASGNGGYADALSAAPLAKAKNAPILLTDGNALQADTLKELQKLNVKHVIIVGGTGVIPQSVEDSIKSKVSTVVDTARYGGADRYETSVKIATALGSPSKVVLASGQDYADALSAAPVAAIEGMPILLTSARTLPASVSGYIKDNTQITKTYVIGGYASVDNALLDEVPGSQRIGGIDRFDTNAQVIKAFSSDFNYNNAYAALGSGKGNYADALAGAPLAAQNSNPLVLTSRTISFYTAQLLNKKLDTNDTITAFGGTGVVTSGMLQDLADAVITQSIAVPVTKVSGYDESVSKLNNNPVFSQYATIDAADANHPDVVSVTLKDENPVKSAFTKVQSGVDVDKALSDAQAQIDAVSSGTTLGSLKIGGQSLKDFLGGLDSKYISKDGQLNTDYIKQVLAQRGEEGYSDFQTELQNRIETYFNAHPDKAQLGVSIKDYTLTSITDGSVSYSFGTNGTNKAKAEAIVKFLLPDSSAAGSYKINLQDSGNTHYNFTINLK